MSTISLRIEDELLSQFKEVCDQMWLTMSAILKWVVKKIVRERKVEFSWLTENWFTPEYEQEILDYVNSDEYKNDWVLCGTWEESEKFLRSL